MAEENKIEFYNEEPTEEQLDLEFQRDFDAKEFPTRLVVAFRYSGKQRKDIYEETKINEATISNYTKGKQIPNRKNVEKLAEVLGVTFSWLTGARYANIEYNRYVSLTKKRFSEGFEKRIPKVAMILIKHLHIDPNQIETYIKLIRLLADLKPTGVERLIQFGTDIAYHPRYHMFRSSNLRYSIESDFTRNIDEQLSHYQELIELNDILRKFN